MEDRGFFLTWQAIRRQLAAMPNDLYLVRLIHNLTGRPFPGERLWTAAQLVGAATIRFLRARNCEGCDIYLHPYAGDQNAGYILVDLDHADSAAMDLMRANGHDPCVVVQTSPGHLQAWLHLSRQPLPPALATAVAKHLARAYGGDLASADWRHLGRLAGFTNQKPLRRQSNGYAPWVRLLYAQLGLARNGASLVQAAEQPIGSLPSPFAFITATGSHDCELGSSTSSTLSAARDIYQAWLQRLRIPQRFPHPDWSIADKWIAKELLRRGTPVATVAELLRCGSPGFPRHHADPENYLHRTVERALGELTGTSFPARARRALCGGGGDLAPPTLHHKVTR